MENVDMGLFRLNRKDSIFLLYLIIVLVFFSLTSLYSYLFFHTLAELFSIVIAAAIFIIAWNSRDYIDNNYLLFIGIAYLFIGGIDFLHTLAYKGMNIFMGFDANLPTQLWIAGRYMEAATLIAAALLISRRINVYKELVVYLAIFSALVISIFSGIFPDCFIEGQGLTAFKVVSEYIISLMLVMAVYLLLKRKDSFEPKIFNVIIISIFFTILSEIAFTFYVSVYGFSNLVGHLFKIISFALIYYALVESGIRRPYEIIFRNLSEKEKEVAKERDTLDMYLKVAGVIFLVLDMEGIVRLINPKGCKVLGYDKNEIVGKKFFEEYIPEYLREETQRVFTGITIEGVVPSLGVEWDVLTKSGETRTLLWQYSIIRDEEGNITGVLGSGEDITERRRAVEALRESEKLLDNVGEMARVGGWELDVKTKDVRWTKETYRIHEIPEDEKYDLSKAILFYDLPGRSDLETALQRCMENGEPFDLELLFTTAKGRHLWVRSIGRAVSADGEVVKLKGTFQDITELKQAGEEIRKMELVVRYSREFISTASPDGIINFINEAGARMVGRSIKDIINTNLMEIIPDDQKENIESVVLPTLIEKGTWEGDIQYQNIKTGKPVDVHAMAFTINDPENNKPLYLANVSLDITDRKNAEKSLKEVNKKLNLLSSITRHDILNQITGAAGYAQLIEMGSEIPPGSKAAEYIKKISGAVETIKRQILFTKDYKDLGEQAPDWFDLGEIVTAAYENSAFKGIELKNDLKNIEIYADPLLEKVIYNLFDNAVKHGEKITKISFSAEESPEELVITCEDDGIGIPDEVKEKIFRREYFKNSGLGLFLSREILGITGMTIQETGKFGEGARFQIHVPAGKYRFSE